MRKRERMHHLKLIAQTERPSPKKKRFRAVKRVLAVAVLLLFLKMGHALFTVREIRVAGPAVLEQNAIIELSGIKKGSSIFLVNVDKAAARLQAHPSVRNARVSRVFPSTVEIYVQGRTPAAFILAEGHCWLVDGDGIVFDRGVEITGGLPVITGIDAGQLILGEPLRDPELAETLRRFIANLAAVPGLKPAELNLTDTKEMVLYLASGLRVLLGDSENMARKLTLVQETLPYLSGVDASCLDVRTGDRLVVVSGM